MKNRTRTIVTIIGVILSAALIAGVTTFISSLQEYMLRDAIRKYGEWEAGFSLTTKEIYERVKDDPAVKEAFFIELLGYGLLDPENEHSMHYNLSAYSERALEILPITLLSGRLPQSSDEIVIPYGVGGHWNEYNVGDTVTLEYVGSAIYDEFIPDNIKTYNIVGFCDTLWHTNFRTFITAHKPNQTTQDSYGESGLGNFIVYVKLNNHRDAYSFTRKINADHFVFPFHNTDYLRGMGVTENDNFQAVIYSLGAILIVLIMVGSVLLIYNAFAISVSERTRQFGILSSVGATGRQLRKSVLFEGLCVGVIGIPIGILAGIGGIAVTLSVVGEMLSVLMSGQGEPLRIAVSWQAVVIAAAVGIVTIYISAYIPASRASKKSAIDSIRQSADIKINPKKIKSSKLFEKILGVEGMLSRKNFKRNKKLYRSTIISLFVSVVLFVAAGSFAMYLRQTSETSISVSNCDISVFFYERADTTDDDIIKGFELLKNADGVYAYGYQFIYNTLSPINTSLLSQRVIEYEMWLGDKTQTQVPDEVEFSIILMFMDDASYLEYLTQMNLSESIYYNNEAKSYPVYARVIRHNFETGRIENYNMFITNSFNMTLYDYLNEDNTLALNPGIDIAVTIADRLPDNIGYNQFSQPLMILPYSHLMLFDFPESFYMTECMTFLSNDPNASAAHIESLLMESELPNNFRVTNYFAQEEANRRIIYVVNIFTYGFIILMSLITVANVFNTVTTNVSIRRREFAMLKSMGMTDSGLNKMVTYECFFYGIKALLFSLPVSVLVAWLIYTGVMQGVDVDFMLPWDSILIATAGVFMIVLVTMMYAVGRVKKENIIDTLRSEIA